MRGSIESVARARMGGVTNVEPNTPGLKAGESKMGIMPAQVFRKGSVGEQPGEAVKALKRMLA